MQPMTFEQAQGYAVNRSQEYEVTRQSIYDFQVYASGGQTSLTFFQVPIGQAGKTIADTNMELAGQLPAPKFFVVESIEVYFYPFDSPTLLTATADLVAVQPEFVNDVYAVEKSGSLDFFIGSKSYLQEAPIGRFPPKTKLETSFGESIHYTQAIAADVIRQVSDNYAAFAGRPYFLDPYKILIAPTQNFNVKLTWPAVIALPSGSNGRIGIVMDGVLFRLSQ